MREVVDGMSHLREPRVVNVDVLDGVEGAPYRMVPVDDVMVVGAADVCGVVGVVYRAVVLVEVVVVPMRHPLGEGVTRLTDPVSGLTVGELLRRLPKR